ncbi:MAG TPA: sugar ABC transporter permease [Anaerolineaceae bacterium]|nr:sugar ABC transporter permease [Anaerolineaceae bacterium]
MEHPVVFHNLRKATESKLLFPIIALAIILLFDLIFIPNFFQVSYQQGHLYGSLIDILRNSMPVVALAIGMTFVIATGGIDLSVGATMAIVSSVAALLINPFITGTQLTGIQNDPAFSNSPFWLVILLPLLVSIFCGLWNGTLVAYGKIQPMVATLILMISGRGIAQLITNSQKILIFYKPFLYIGHGWLVLPFAFFIVVALFIIAWLISRKTSIGLFIESVGANPRSSMFSGIDEKKVKLFAYIFCGFCAGVAGLIETSNITTCDASNLGMNMELDAILAVVIGGTMMSGGRYSLMASAIGGLAMQAVTTTMYAVGVSANSLLAVKGVVVILIILLYSQQVKDLMRRIFITHKVKETRS